MSIENFKTSPIYASVNPIMQSSSKPVRTRLSAILSTSSLDYTILNIESVNVFRDYASSITDHTQIRINVPWGDYVYLIYPNRHNLELTLSKTVLNESGDSSSGDSSVTETVYKVTFDPTNPNFVGTEIGSRKQSDLNNSTLVSVSLQLLDRRVEAFRFKMVDGVYRGATAKQLISALLLGQAQKVQISGTPSADGIDLVEPDNTTVFTQAVFPSGTRAIRVPTYIQERIGGVYKNAIGTYFQTYNDLGLWFVYPLYDHTRFDNNTGRDVVTFYATPKQITTGMERTYLADASSLSIAVTAERLYFSVDDITQMNEGVGFRMVDQTAFTTKPATFDNNEPVASRANLNREVSFISRDDGLTNSPVVNDYSTNPYSQLSKIAARQTAIVRLTWENANPDLLYPGMPAKYVFMQGENLVEIKGTVQTVEIATVMQSNTLSNTLYLTNCIVTLATEVTTFVPDYEDQGVAS